MSDTVSLEVNPPALRRARLAKALTQVELARLAGVNRATVVRLEAGRPASPSSVRRIAGALGVEVAAVATVREVLAS